MMKKLLTVFFILFFVFVPLTVFAQDGIPPGGGSTGGDSDTTIIKNPLQVQSIDALLEALVDIVVRIGFYVALVGIIYSGFLFVTAQGDTGKLETARKALTYSLVGTAVLLGAWVLSAAIKGAVDNVRSQTEAPISTELAQRDAQ